MQGSLPHDTNMYSGTGLARGRFPVAANCAVMMARGIHSASLEIVGPEHRTMLSAPMLADFAVRLAFGLSLAAVLVSWREVPLPFFRTQAQIILGLLVLAALDQARVERHGHRLLDDRAGCGAGLRLVDRLGPGAAGPGVRTAGLTAVAAMVLAYRLLRCGPRSARARAQRRQPGRLGISAGCSALLDAPGPLLPDRAGDDDRSAQANDRLDRLGARGARAAGRDRLAIARAGLGGQSFGRERSRCDGPFLRPLGHGIRGRGDRHLHDLEDGADSLDAVGDGHSLHHDDLCFFRRALVTGALRAVRRHLLTVRQRPAPSISGGPNDYNRDASPAWSGHVSHFQAPGFEGGSGTGEMELTFSCKQCGAVGYVSPLEGSLEAACRHCGTARPIDRQAARAASSSSARCAGRADLYIQKDFPTGLGLFIVLVGFAISTVFWYYEMPILTYLVLIISIAVDFVLYYKVPDVTICYRCLSQYRGTGANAARALSSRLIWRSASDTGKSGFGPSRFVNQRREVRRTAVDEARARIYDDLRGVVEGELYFEPLDRAPYAIDASLYEIDPLGVVVPRSEHDVVNVVRYAAENRISVHVRGRRHRHRRRVAGARAGRRLEPASSPGHLDRQRARGGRGRRGARRAQRAARALGRRLEPVTHNSDVTTVGGMIAVDAAGPRSLKYGSTSDQVDRLRVVFARGEVADVGFEAWPAYESEPVDFKDVVVRKLQTIYRNSEGRLAKISPPAPARPRRLIRSRGPPAKTGIHLGRLLAGSEGTLCVTLQAVLRTVPIPAACGVMLLSFGGLLDAAAFVSEILVPELGPTSCDLFDRRSLSLARDADASFRGWIDESAEAVLTVEFEGQRDRFDRRHACATCARWRPGRACSSASRSAPSSDPNAIVCWGCGGWSSRCSCGLAAVPGRSRSSTTWRCRPTSSPPCCSGFRACFSSRTSPGRSTPAPA